MPIPIGKSEFFARLNAAVVMHQNEAVFINSNGDLDGGERTIAQWRSAADSAKKNMLPAVAQPLNPMVAAIVKIGGTFNERPATFLEAMALSERAWEYLLNDLDAHAMFKELNP